jgi:broad specificity phosphatase PhoE
MPTIYLVRHGETDANRELRWQGHRDTELNEVGRAQAEAVADALEALPFAAIYASDLARARDTAAPLAARLGLELRIRPALREIDVGSWEGKTLAEVSAEDPEAAAAHAAGGAPWTGGETYEELYARTVEALRGIGRELPAGDVAAAFAHGGTVRAAVAAALGAPPIAARRSVGAFMHGHVTILRVRDAPPPWLLLAHNLPASAAVAVAGGHAPTA